MSLPTVPTSLMECIKLLDEGQVTSLQLVNTYLERIHAANGHLHALLHIDEQNAVAHARGIDALRANYQSALGPLAGAPLSVKDLFDTSFAPTTYGSNVFRGHQPETTAVAVKRLIRAGGIVIGKAHMHEFAYGITNENAAYGHARNPVDPARITGGSSGGSAASVRAGFAAASIGTDTGGSVRIPASLTGVVGYKPSYGMIPTEGVFPLSRTLDHVGPITLTVDDAALLTEVMSDKTLSNDGRHDGTALSPNRPIRVAVPRQLIERFASDEVLQVFEDALQRLEQRGYITYIGAVSFDIDTLATYQGVIMGSEAFAVHQTHLQKHGHQYGSDVHERLSAAAEFRASDYVAAGQFRMDAIRRFDAWFDDADVIFSPTTPIVACPIGTDTCTIRGATHPVRQLMTRFTNPWNFTGFPAISIPGLEVNGLPVGLQLAGRFLQDERLLCFARRMEQALSELFDAAPRVLDCNF